MKVTGQWQGKIVEANDSIYLDLTQTPDGFVTGKMCEAPPNKDCNVIANGTFDGKELAFGVSWAENGNVETVDVDFEITGGGNALTGYVTSTKCNNCKYTAQLLKQ